MRVRRTSTLLLVLGVFAARSASAGTGALEKEASERFVVSASRAPRKAAKVPKNITVLTSTDLAKLPAANPAEALSYVSGVDVDLRTKAGHLSPLSIRGSMSNQVLVLVDGIPFNTQASGQADVLGQLPMQALDRIEIVKGAGSNVWGTGTGGTVQLVTKDVPLPPRPEVKLTTAWGRFGARRRLVEARAAAVGTSFYFSGEHSEFGGSREKSPRPNRDDTLQKKFFGKATRAFDALKATVSFGYSGAELNEGFYPTVDQRVEVPYYARYGQLRLESGEEGEDRFEAALKFNAQHFVTDTHSSAGLLSSVRHRDDYAGAELKRVTHHRDGRDQLVLGYDLEDHRLKSDQMHVARDVWVQAPYADYAMGLDPVDLTFGARYDFNEEFGGQFNPSAGAVLQWPGSPDTRLRVNVARAFNPPPLLWKYFEDVSPGVTVNNPGIRAERAWVYEASAETRPLPGLWTKLAVYRADISDAIATTANGAGLFIKQNFQKFRQQTVEWESHLELCPQASLSFAAGANDVEDRATRLHVRGRGVTRPYFRVGLDYEKDGWQASLKANYNRWDSRASQSPNDRKFILDARISRVLVSRPELDVSVFLNLYNLTNSKYWNDINFPLPERTVEGGVSIRF